MVRSAGLGAGAYGEFGVGLSAEGLRGRQLDQGVPDSGLGEQFS